MKHCVVFRKLPHHYTDILDNTVNSKIPVKFDVRFQVVQDLNAVQSYFLPVRIFSHTGVSHPVCLLFLLRLVLHFFKIGFRRACYNGRLQ